MSNASSIAGQLSLSLSLEAVVSQGINNVVSQGINPGEVHALLLSVNQLLTAAQQQFATSAGSERSASYSLTTIAPVSEPDPADSFHPAASLRAEGSVITTPGGYRIEMLGQYEWKITGTDGKETRVWGDPHVAEGDGGTWDFKRNSTFVLGDGTRINVTTVPAGAAGMTVTGQLEVISGNDRVVATGIDKGKGQIGTVTQDGYSRTNSFQGDVFVMGREADDWSYTGREITGSERGGEEFKLGGQLNPPDRFAETEANAVVWAKTVLGEFMDVWNDAWRPNRYGCNPYWNADRPDWQSDTPRPYDRQQYARQLATAFRAMAMMFAAYAATIKLDAQLSAARRPQIISV